MSPAEVASPPATHPEIVDIESCGSRAVVDRWRALAFDLQGTSYFQTPDWILSWWRTIADRPTTSLALWSNAAGTLQAVVGLSRVRHRVDRRLPVSIPVIANAGSGPGDADHCGPLVDPSVRREVEDWLFDVAARATLLLRNVDAAEGSLQLPGARLITTTACPRLHIDDRAGPVARSSNFRRQLGRFERQLRRDGVEFEWIPPGDLNEAMIHTLFELHRRRRDAAHATSALDERHRSLLLALLETASPGRGPAAAVARVGPRVVGVVVGFRWKETFSAYQSGWDPNYAASSLGSVLLRQAIEMAAQSGVQTFDFLRGDESYKYRFGAVDTFDRSYLLAHGLAGRALGLESALRNRVQAFRRARRSPRTDRRAAAPR